MDQQGLMSWALAIIALGSKTNVKPNPNSNPNPNPDHTLNPHPNDGMVWYLLSIVDVEVLLYH